MAGELISREALERIIQRAAELQTGEREIGDGLTKEEVVQLGADVGIPARYLQQALLEEQTRSVVVAAHGAGAWLLGPRLLHADRVVPGERAAVEQALLHWMQDEELLQVKRRYPDRITWEPKAGGFAALQRAFGGMSRSYPLARVSEVAAQVTQLEPGFCHVQLQADVHNFRMARLQGAVAMAVFSTLATGAMMVIGAFGVLALVPIVAGVPGAVAVARTYGRQNERVQTALEQVLDRLERGEIRAEHLIAGPRQSAFMRIADEIKKTFQG
ncbi:MAG TPA: hypothetical protein VNG95_06245 [Gemmatimonadales bacterium]|nr:hypothetical protein [Gemmatimonadales bacterium]